MKLRKTDAQPARGVVFAPAQQNLRRQGNPKGLKRSFFHRPLTAGDVIAPTGQQQVDRGDMPPQLRQMLAAPAYALQEIRLAVVSTVPKRVVHISAETEVELRPDYEEPREHPRADVPYDDVGRTEERTAGKRGPR